VLSAVYYRDAPVGNGVHVSTGDASIYDALYFSIVTFSSLGYGDIVPLGWGCLLACVEVLGGLVLLSLLVAKLASERQSALIRLIYTSDHQRRISSFRSDLVSLAERLKSAREDYDHGLMLEIATAIEDVLLAIKPYLRFQAHEGGLLEFGNISSLRSLYKSLAVVTHISSKVSLSHFTKDNSKHLLNSAVERAGEIATMMIALHGNNSDYRALNGVLGNVASHRKLLAGNDTKEHGIITETCLRNVRNALPLPPWPTDVHILVARRLSIPNKHAVRCIQEIVHREKAISIQGVNVVRRSSANSLIEAGLLGLLIGCVLTAILSKKNKS
jgi:hypothetical protein